MLSAESSNLDLLRAVAVLCVFFAHLAEAIMGHHAEITWHIGQLGVLMFFVHTSLVLMASLGRLRVGGWKLPAVFYIRRTFRIYPLSVFCILGTLLLFPQQHHNGFRILANLTLTQNLFYQPDIVGVTWTLPLEMQMYLFLPMLFVFCRSSSIYRAFGIWLISVALGWVIPPISHRLEIFDYAPTFLGGVIAWCLLSRRDHARFIPAWCWTMAIPLISLIWIIATREHREPYRWIFGLALGLAIPWFRELSAKCVVKPSAIIAKYSYGIYLTHPTALWLCFVALTKQAIWLRSAALIVFASVAPVILYHFIEHPMIRIGRRVSSFRTIGNSFSLLGVKGA